MAIIDYLALMKSCALSGNAIAAQWPQGCEHGGGCPGRFSVLTLRRHVWLRLR